MKVMGLNPGYLLKSTLPSKTGHWIDLFKIIVQYLLLILIGWKIRKIKFEIRCRIRWTAINFHFVPDGDEDEDEIVDDDALSQPREEPASLEDLPSDQFDMPKRETSV